MEVEGGQIYLASNSKANGLNEAISSQVVHIVVLNKLILLRESSRVVPELHLTPFSKLKVQNFKNQCVRSLELPPS